MEDNINISELIDSAEEIIEIQTKLAETGDNIVSFLIKNEKSFIEWEHYPNDDVIDNSGSQYYFHSHPGKHRDFNEFGHFHLFMKNKKPEFPDTLPLTHIIAISVDEFGSPNHLFTVNHWVTGGFWEKSDLIINFLDRFSISEDKSPELVNKWICAMIRLYREDIVKLLRDRDRKIKEWQEEYKEEDIFQRRDLEIPSFTEISIESKLKTLYELSV
jgi:hypothetical protein